MNQRNWFRSWHRVTFFYYFVEGGWSFNAASLWYFSSGNRKCEWFVKFYSSLINYERICRTILILRYFSNGIGVALESWERKRKERNTRRTLLPIQFWRKHRIFNFLCNDHLPLNRLEPIYPFQLMFPHLSMILTHLQFFVRFLIIPSSNNSNNFDDGTGEIIRWIT